MLDAAWRIPLPARHIERSVNMNKLTKGAIAGAAGIALLLGGAGSFALWNGNASVSAGQVQSGTLTIAASGTGTWQNTPNGSSTPAAVTIGTFKAVPGDTLTFTQQLNITAIGDNLSAALTVDPTTIVAGNASPASAALKTALLNSMTVAVTTLPLPTGITGPTANTYTVTGATGIKTITVTVTLPFPRTSDNTTQAGSVDLTGLKFTLNQN